MTIVNHTLADKLKCNNGLFDVTTELGHFYSGCSFVSFDNHLGDVNVITTINILVLKDVKGKQFTVFEGEQIAIKFI